VGAAFQVGAKFGLGRCGGIEKTSLISLTSEERRTRPHMRASIAPRGRRPKPLAVGTRCNPRREHLENIPKEVRARAEPPMFFTFPEDARWNAERQAVEFGVEIGEYQGVVRVPRRVFQRLSPTRPRAAEDGAVLVVSNCVVDISSRRCG
jgi:hypothetical protein